MKLSKLNARLFQIARNWAEYHFDSQVGLILAYHPANGHMRGHDAHLLRESLYYAYGLIQLGSKDEVARAAKIIELALTKQNLDPKSKFWACFTCEWEQDWETWDTPDMNWAQFMGLIFAFILGLERERSVLPAALVEKLTAAFELTVQATLRRDVTPSYTNISFLSAAVAAAGADLLGLKEGEEFAFRKLAEVRARTEGGKTFDEYLSPTYYKTNLYGLYAVQKFATTDRVRAAANGLLQFTWNDIDGAYHPKTFQLAGPHSRAYGDNMVDYSSGLKFLLYLALDGNYPLRDLETNHAHDSAGLFISATFDIAPRPGLGKKPDGYLEIALPPEKGQAGQLRQYREESFILGTVDAQNEWDQRRNLLAYWVTGALPQIGVAKGAAFLGEGAFRDARFYSTQVDRAVLVAVNLSLPPGSKENADYRFSVNAAPQRHEVLASGEIALRFAGQDIRVASLASGPRPELRREKDKTSLVWTFPPAASGNAWLAFAVVFSPPGATIPAFTELTSSVDRGERIYEIMSGTTRLRLAVPPD